MGLISIFNDFVHTIFPENCQSCNTVMVAGEIVICTNCRLTLPKTTYFQIKENPLKIRFYGRIAFDFAASFLVYSKQSRVQNILKAIKYNHAPEVANYFGHWMAEELVLNNHKASFDVIIPVPLHVSRHKYRGYNQAEELAKPIAEKLNLKLDTKSVIRIKSTLSQTKLTGEKRFDNVKEIFFIDNGKEIQGKSILLIDDVITTGATIESLANEILKFKPKNLNMLSLAFASNLE